MRIVELTGESKKNILNDLLKRSPNNYSEYESTVNEILEDVRKSETARYLPIHRNLTILR